MHVARHLFTTWAFSLSLSPLPHHFSSAVWSHRCDLSLAWDITSVTSPTWQKARNLQWSQLASVRVRVHGCLFVTFADLRQKQCLPLALIFPHFICSRPLVSSRPPPEQARRELRRLKEEARQKHAVAVIWAYWQGLQVPSSPPPPPRHSHHQVFHLPLTTPWLHLILHNCLFLFFPYFYKPVSAHCSNHTSAHDGIVFKTT